MPKATQRKDGRWIAFARVAKGTKGRIAVYGHSQEATELRAEELEQEAKRHTRELPKYKPGSFAHFFYGTYVPHVYPSLKAPSKRSYDSQTALHILPALGEMMVADIGYKEVKDMMDGLTRKDKRRPKDSKGNYIEVPLPDPRKYEVVMRTKEILTLHNKLASGRKETTRDDWAVVAPPQKKRKKVRDEPPVDFTERLLAASVGTYMIGPHFFALFFGARRGETCGLTKDKIDRANLTITLSEQLQPETGDRLVETKGDTRVLPITQEMLEWLDRFSSKNSIFVFTDKKGHPLKPNEISKMTPRICAKAGLPKTGFHDLRSFAASNLLSLGVEIMAISEILGHEELATTLKYLNARKEAKRQGLGMMLSQVAKSVDTALADSRKEA